MIGHKVSYLMLFTGTWFYGGKQAKETKSKSMWSRFLGGQLKSKGEAKDGTAEATHQNSVKCNDCPPVTAENLICF